MKEAGIFKLARGVRQIVRNIFDVRAKKISGAHPGTPDWYIQKLFGGDEIYSGAEVNENTAQEYIAFWACLKVIRETIASLPMILYKRTDVGKERAVDHPAYRVLHLKANPEQAAFDYKEMTSGHYLLYGNSYSEKVFNNSGELVELWPLMPWKMEVKRIGGTKWYKYWLKSDEPHFFRQEEVLHISNYSLTGLAGERPLDFSQQSIGAGLAADEYSARFFSNDATPGGIIEHPGRIKGDGKERLKAGWEKNYGSLDNKHRVAILEEGAKFHELTITPDKAQFLETRKFQQQLMSSFTRVPPHLIGDLEHATYSNIEQQSLDFITNTMLSHFVRWEQNYTIQLLTETDQQDHFYEILVDAITRGDIETRYNAYRIGREVSILSPNDCRERENLNRIPGGDVLHVPMNWIELGAPQPTPIEPDGEEEPEEQEENKLKIIKEQRDLRAAMKRKNIAASFRPLFLDVMQRIMKREIAELRKGVKKYLMERTREEFDKWYKDFYNGLHDWIKTRVMPIYNALYGSVFEEIKDEMFLSQSDEDKNDFVSGYAEVFTRKYIKEKKKNVGFAVTDAISNEKDIAERMDELYDKWDRNLQNDNHNETVKGSNAFAKNIYLLAGVSYLRWVNTGSNPCPYCQSMHGQTVGINQVFVQSGSVIQGGDRKDNLNIDRDIGHGPLHTGCECQILAV